MKKSLLILSALICSSVFAKFSHESELSMVVVGGNSESETYYAKTQNIYELNKNKFTLGGHYTLGSSKADGDLESEITVRNWDINLRYDRSLTQKIGLFLGEQIEGDKFSGYDKRYNTDFGLRYDFIKNDKTTLYSDLGYRYTVEKKVDNTETKDHKARVYLENTNVHNETLSSKFWIEYLPNFSESEDWIINFEPSLKVNLHKMLSLKLAYKGTYDNQPAVLGNKKFDYAYTTALIAKF